MKQSGALRFMVALCTEADFRGYLKKQEAQEVEVQLCRAFLRGAVDYYGSRWPGEGSIRESTGMPGRAVPRETTSGGCGWRRLTATRPGLSPIPEAERHGCGEPP